MNPIAVGTRVATHRAISSRLCTSVGTSLLRSISNLSHPSASVPQVALVKGTASSESGSCFAFSAAWRAPGPVVVTWRGGGRRGTSAGTSHTAWTWPRSHAALVSTRSRRHKSCGSSVAGECARPAYGCHPARSPRMRVTTQVYGIVLEYAVRAPWR